MQSTRPSNSASMPSIPASKNERIHYMDSMRSVLMILGVVLHSGQVYNPSQSWLIYSDSTSQMAGILVTVIHIFRMPAFFVVSGYFCIVTLRKWNLHKFLQIRLQRIVIPLAFTALTLNVIQEYVLTTSNWSEADWLAFWADGGWVHHLWFLVNLIVYFLLFALLGTLINDKVKDWLTNTSSLLVQVPVWLVVSLLPFGYIGFLAANRVGLPIYAEFLGFILVIELLGYLPFFAFGAILAADNKILGWFSNKMPIGSIAVLVIMSIALSPFLEGESIINRFATEYLTGLQSWVGVIVCFYCFFRMANSPSLRWQYLSEASYSVYLFHHLCVVSLGIVFINYNLPALAGLMSLIVVTLVITLSIHHFLILKIPLLRYLYNGKRRADVPVYLR